MIKKICLLLGLLLTTTLASAQSVSKQINDIKRDTAYISAEATLETEAKAYELAEELLTHQIEEYIGDRKVLRKAPNVIVKDVAHKAERIMMNRGEMTRVFLYVKKSDVIAAQNTRVLVQPGNVKSTDENSGQPGTVVIEAPAVPNDTAKNDTIAKREGTIEPPSWQRQVIDDLLKCATVTEAQSVLSRLQAEMKVKRYGRPDNCSHPDKCYWLIFDGEGKVITVLGPGIFERTNYRTNTTDNLSNFRGNGAVWFTLSN